MNKYKSPASPVSLSKQYQSNHQALDRMLSMQSISSPTSLKYQLKYRQLKTTYNSLLTTSQQLQCEYNRIIQKVNQQHKEEIKQLESIHQIEINKLKQVIRVLEIKIQDKQYKIRMHEDMKEIEQRKAMLIIEEQRGQLINQIQTLRRQKYLMNVQKQKMQLDSSHEMMNIKSMIDKLDILAKELQITKLALDSQKMKSQILEKELIELRTQINRKNQQNYNLLKDQVAKGKTIEAMETMIDNNQVQRSNNNNKNSSWKKELGMGSPNKGKVMSQIQRMIENYKRNLKQ